MCCEVPHCLCTYRLIWVTFEILWPFSKIGQLDCAICCVGGTVSTFPLNQHSHFSEILICSENFFVARGAPTCNMWLLSRLLYRLCHLLLLSYKYYSPEGVSFSGFFHKKCLVVILIMLSFVLAVKTFSHS